MVNKIFFTLLILFPFYSYAGIWTIQSQVLNTHAPTSKNKEYKSEISFKSRDGRSFKYVPEKFPWDYNRYQEIVISGRTFYLTIWYVGARSMHFKVFEPDISTKPICEVDSDINKAQLKRTSRGIEIEVVTIKSETQINKEWVLCQQINKQSKTSTPN